MKREEYDIYPSLHTKWCYSDRIDRWNHSSSIWREKWILIHTRDAYRWYDIKDSQIWDHISRLCRFEVWYCQMVSSARTSEYNTQKSIKRFSIIKMSSSFSILRYFLHILLVLWGIFCIGYSIFVYSSQNTQSETLWIVDTSLSMGVEDIVWVKKDEIESRFALAKSIMKEWITRIPGRHAVIVYAQNSGIASPFSSDISHLSQVVNNLNIIENYGGSDLSSALSLAKSIYLSSGSFPHIIILTDGGLAEGSTLPDLPWWSHITLIALWSDAGGKIPLGYNAQGERRYKYYEGKEIVVPLDEKNIDMIRRKYNTSLFRITDRANSLDFLDEKRNFIFSYSILRILGIVMTILGFLIHPYVRKKK